MKTLLFALMVLSTITLKAQDLPALKAEVIKQDSILNVVFYKYIAVRDSMSKVNSVTWGKEQMKLVKRYNDSAQYYFETRQLDLCIEFIHRSDAVIKLLQKATGIKKD